MLLATGVSYSQTVYQVGSRTHNGGIVFSIDTQNNTVSEMIVINGRYTYAEAIRMVQQWAGWRIPTISELTAIYNNLHRRELYHFFQEGRRMGWVWSSTADNLDWQQTVNFNQAPFSNIWVSAQSRGSRIHLIVVHTFRNIPENRIQMW